MAKPYTALKSVKVDHSNLRTRFRRQEFNTGGKNIHFKYVGGIPKKGGR